ncbi:MAG TPA: prolyl oligopeptidase family serine peptidase, partial [Vicinamibacteria bacterium]|nr:prolyl oligopeptidase family serine peptidase [Vicinamibacteria bacterium]
FFDYLATSGYVLLDLDHRGSSGHGRAYRDAAIGTWGTGTLEDVKAAAAWLKAQPFVDADRVGVMGLSFGGYLTLLALVQEPALFAAGIDLMGVADRRGPLAGRNFVFHVGKTEAEAPELYARLSPITQVEALRAPLLILHSDQDRNVAPEQTYSLVDELRRRQKPFEVQIYPGEAHGLADPVHQLDSYRRIVAFLGRTLGAGQKREELAH